ncbi:MAG: hypothetical protein ABR585_01530 [Gemmatimonadaceae bacterium]
MNRLIVIALVVVITACAKDDSANTAQRTQREKDSILAHSQIPGAKAVNKAFNTADSARARQARLDSAQQEP